MCLLQAPVEVVTFRRGAFLSLAVGILGSCTTVSQCHTVHLHCVFVPIYLSKAFATVENKNTVTNLR